MGEESRTLVIPERQDARRGSTVPPRWRLCCASCVLHHAPEGTGVSVSLPCHKPVPDRERPRAAARCAASCDAATEGDERPALPERGPHPSPQCLWYTESVTTEAEGPPRVSALCTPPPRHDRASALGCPPHTGLVDAIDLRATTRREIGDC